MPLTSVLYVPVQGVGGHHAYPGANIRLTCSPYPLYPLSLCLGRRPWCLASGQGILPFLSQGSFLYQNLVRAGELCSWSLGRAGRRDKATCHTPHTHNSLRRFGVPGWWLLTIADKSGTEPLAEESPPSEEGMEDGHFAHWSTPSLLCSSSVETAA